MKTYFFKTTATMKEYNYKKWWIDPKIISDLEVQADTLESALKQYQSIAKEKYYVEISNNALKNKAPMYITVGGEDKQIGFIITGKTEFEHNYKWSVQYINLWITVKMTMDIEF